jgi:hypothetical protein
LFWIFTTTLKFEPGNADDGAVTLTAMSALCVMGVVTPALLLAVFGSGVLDEATLAVFVALDGAPVPGTE